MIGSAMPVFWFGLILIYVFYFVLGLAPAPLGRIGLTTTPPDHITGLYVLDSLLMGNPDLAWKCLRQLLLPAITLSMGSMSILARMSRNIFLEIMSQDYVRMARAKGLSRRAIIWKHGFGNALIPILTVLGSQIGVLLGATVVTETIFSWPGIGSYLTQSILLTDYAPIQAFALLSAVIYIVINLLLDIAYVIVDPRVDLQS
jgi:peptide/nickel transport system permease protein